MNDTGRLAIDQILFYINLSGSIIVVLAGLAWQVFNLLSMHEDDSDKIASLNKRSKNSLIASAIALGMLGIINSIALLFGFRM